MLRNLKTALTIILVTAATVSAQQLQPATGKSNSPWVVSVVHTVDLNKLLERMREQKQARVGVPGSLPPYIYNVATGLVVDNAGHVVTRLAHLSPQDKDSNISITTGDGTSLPARLIGIDCATGFAVLHVESLKVPAPSAAATALTNGMPVRILSTDVVQKAASVDKNTSVQVAPSITVTRGQIGTDSIYSKARGALTLLSIGLTSRNDSSVVSTFENEIVGIAQWAGFGRAYLFPIALIRDTVAKRVIEKNDSVAAGWLGAVGDSLAALNDKERESLGLTRKSGVIVREVAPGSPAASSGILINDVIVAANDFDIVGTADLSAIVSSSPAGHSLKLRAIRNRAPVDVEVVLGARAYSGPTLSLLTEEQAGRSLVSERDQIESRLAELKAEYRKYQGSALSRERNEALREIEMEIRQLYDNLRALEQQGLEPAKPDLPALGFGKNESRGVSFSVGFMADCELTPQMATFLGTKNGVWVISVEKGSAAEKAGLKTGDVIVGIEDEKLVSCAQLKQSLSIKPSSFSLRIVRDRQPVVVKF